MINKKKIYISGQISGIEEQAPKLFQEAETLLANSGYEVINPMKLPHDHDKSWESYMREDIKALMDCDEIYMLKGWSSSKGARVEFALACSLGVKVKYQ
jgi:hypothetical protein